MARRASGAPPRVVKVTACAKLNLGLAVGPRRPDGDHELATVFQSISLADTLVAERRARGFRLTVRHEDASVRTAKAGSRAFVPAGPSNLVLRAARRFADAFGLEAGASFTLIKRIPSRAGLGGGSADAAAALRALAALYRVRATRAGLRALAAGIGADVPFALRGGTAIGFGRGDELRPARLDRPFRALVAVPSWRVSTSRAFAEIDRNNFALTRWKAKLRFVQSFSRKRLSVARALRLGNDFEDVLGSHRARFATLRGRLSAAGLSDVRLTGSGSAVFGILPTNASVGNVTGRISGTEALYVVRSRGAGLRLTKSR
jgi:4-diphosphocytidyl-2-C-methyl-D-erythritol kinase